MLLFLKNKIKDFWSVGHERTLQIKKNIIYSFLIKGLSVLIGYLLLPLTINYVNAVQYGIWVTVASLVAWINTFDIGLSNGLRNKLAHSLALNDHQNSRKYISTTYAMLFAISFVVFALVFAVGSFFDWNRLLHIQNAISYNVWPIFVIAMACFCAQFALQPINTILIATHKPFKSSFILFLGQLITFIVIYILTQTGNGDLYKLVAVVAGTPVIILLVSTVYLFGTELKAHMPAIKFIDRKSATGLLSVGSAFFIIQIGALVLYETDNIVITRTLGPLAVTSFNIAYKYFSILTIIFTIIITPYWSAFTDAFAKDDIGWIKMSLKKIKETWVYVSIAAFLFYFIADTFYRLWIGNSIVVSRGLSLSMAAYVIVQGWMVVHAYLLNGVGKLRVQLILVIFTGFINIPLSVYLIQLIGLPGTVIANVLVMLFMNVFLTRQCYLILNRKATGVWDT